MSNGPDVVVAVVGCFVVVFCFCLCFLVVVVVMVLYCCPLCRVFNCDVCHFSRPLCRALFPS